MKQGGLYGDRGLILGPNSPFKIDETDGNDGHIYRLKKLMKYSKY